jgi:tRNA A37 threonylcarbamoyladenosine biosynthesis protein TsaE
MMDISTWNGPVRPEQLVTDDYTLLRDHIGRHAAGLVVIDGCLGAGKTYLAQALGVDLSSLTRAMIVGAAV